RGGLGHRLVVGTADEQPFSVLLTAERVDHPPRGLKGGRDGGAARVRLRSGKKLRGKGQQTVPAGDAVVLEIAGGGGYGDPLAREPEKVAADLRAGYVSPGAARRIYGVALRGGKPDLRASEKLRAALRLKRAAKAPSR
ncbi:MAG: hydantoinase B/oxoprolinase family protein, partial [Rhodospirillales bacterium]